MGYTGQSTAVRAAYERILSVAMNDTSAASVCEDFLLSWYNVRAWGGWAPQTIAHLDRANAAAIIALLASIKDATWYPDSKDIDRLVATKGRKPISDL